MVKIGIDLIGGRISTSRKSHKAAWAYLLANQLKHKFNQEITVLTKDESWDGYDIICLYHGMEFRDSLNLFGGAKEETAKKYERIIKFEGKLISLDIPMPDYGELCKGRLKSCDDYWRNVNWDLVSKKCKTIPYFKHPEKTNSLLIGDSHSFSVYKPGQMVIRLDHKTLYGALKTGIVNLINENKVDHKTLNHITLYFGNIDVRHHLARRDKIKSSIHSLMIEYEKQIKSLNIKSVELVELLPIEDESRKLPKTGYYEKTPFYGSLKLRSEIRYYINRCLKHLCRKNVWNFYEHHKEIYTKDKKLSFKAMESPRSVHLNSMYYRWDIYNDVAIKNPINLNEEEI